MDEYKEKYEKVIQFLNDLVAEAGECWSDDLENIQDFLISEGELQDA